MAQMHGAINSLTVQERAVAALQIDELDIVGIVALARDLHVLAADEIIPVRIDTDVGGQVAADDQLLRRANRKLIELICASPGQMSDDDSGHSRISPSGKHR